MTLPKMMAKWLSRSDREGLHALVVDARSEVPALREWLEDRHVIECGDAEALLLRLDGVIRRLVPDKRSVELPLWAYEAFRPDASRVAPLIAGAQRQGLHDRLLQRVPALIEAGAAQRETLYKDDFAGDDVTDLLESALQSLRLSSMPPTEQVLYMDALVRGDGYELLPDAAPFLVHCHEDAWRDASDRAPLAIRRCE